MNYLFPEQDQARNALQDLTLPLLSFEDVNIQPEGAGLAVSSRTQDTGKSRPKTDREKSPVQKDTLKLQYGTQYLCQARFDVVGQPGVLQALQGVPHLHLQVDVAIQSIVPEKRLYEVRLTLQGQGVVPALQQNAQPQPVYNGAVSYGGLFAVEGEGAEEARTRCLSEEAPAALFHGARAVLLGLIRDAGFPVGAPQPIDFRHFWDSKKTAVPPAQAALRKGR